MKNKRKSAIIFAMVVLLLFGTVSLLWTFPDDEEDEMQAAFLLKERIAHAESLLAETRVSENGDDVAAGEYWATHADIQDFADAINAAKEAFYYRTLEFEGTIVSKTITKVSGDENLIDVALSLDANSGIRGMSVELHFDEELLTPVEIYEGELTEFGVTYPPTDSAHYNRRVFIILADAQGEMLTQTGLLATVRLQVNGDINQVFPVTLGNIKVILDDDSEHGMTQFEAPASHELLSLFGVPIREEEINPLFQLPNNRYLVGNVRNLGGKPEAVDAALLARYIVDYQASRTNPQNLNLQMADATMDGVIDVADCTWIVRYALCVGTLWC